MRSHERLITYSNLRYHHHKHKGDNNEVSAENNSLRIIFQPAIKFLSVIKIKKVLFKINK